MRKNILLLTLAVISTCAMAADCNEDIIKMVSPDGQVIIMLSGASYNVEVPDYANSRKWTAADNVLICGGAGNTSEIINKDQGSQKISAKRLN